MRCVPCSLQSARDARASAGFEVLGRKDFALAVLVGWGLWTGADWARIVVAILELLYIAGGVYLLFAWSGHYLWQGVWQICVGAFVLWLLFNPRSDQFFEGRRA